MVDLVWTQLQKLSHEIRGEHVGNRLQGYHLSILFWILTCSYNAMQSSTLVTRFTRYMQATSAL